MPPTVNRQGTVREVLRHAAELCARRGSRLTALRRRILELLLRADKPLGAYQLIPMLEADLGRRLAATTVYRVLDFLTELGLVSKIGSRNAFVPCANPQHSHACLFFVCTNCGSYEEIEDDRIEKLLECDANDLRFQMKHRMLEIDGKCSQCV